MTADPTTDRLPLAEAAKAATAAEQQQAKARNGEHREHYLREAEAAGKNIGLLKLGDYGKDVDWTPEGDDNGGSRHWLQATATIDGLRFRATERYYSTGDWGSGYERTLYLRQPCPKDPSHERELEVHSLSGLGAILEDPENWETAWRCFPCEWARQAAQAAQAEQAADEAEPFVPSTTLAEQLDMVVRALVDDQLARRGIGGKL